MAGERGTQRERVKPTVYIAAPFIRQAEARLRSLDLAVIGFNVTSRWLDEEPISNPTPEYQAQRAGIDIEDIDSSDYFVLLAEHDSRTGGKHFETGYAYATGKNVMVVGRRENVFHHLPKVVFAHTWSEATLRMLSVIEAFQDVSGRERE